MEQDFSTPQRALRDTTAAHSTSRQAQTPDQQLGVLRECTPLRSPAPRLPDAASQSRNLLQSQQQQPQQPRRQQDNFRSRGRKGNRVRGGVFQARNSSSSHSAAGGGGGESVTCSWRQRSVARSGASPSHGDCRARKSSPSGNSPDEDRRRCQRDKQINFGYATDGYMNMERLIRHDPLLKSGGLLPLSPPTVLKGSKRVWDIQLRKWRRALHMFDYVFIDDEDDPATRATVLEEQRRQWVSEAYQGAPRELRKRISLDALRRVQHVAAVPTKIPVEEDLRCILRNEDCYESVRSVVPQSASSLTKGTDISPLEAGIKIHIAPSSAVLQRQQAQQELQQRLTLFQQQQQQQQQQRQRCSEAVSPSPRRPLLASPSGTRVGNSSTAANQHQSLDPAMAGSAESHPFTSASHAVPAVGAPNRDTCATTVFSSKSATSAAAASDTAGVSASQPAPFSHHTSLGRMFGEASRSADAAQTSPSPPSTSVLLPPPPPPFSGSTGSPVGVAGIPAPAMFAAPYFHPSPVHVGGATSAAVNLDSRNETGLCAVCAPMSASWCDAPATFIDQPGVFYALPGGVAQQQQQQQQQSCAATGVAWAPQPFFVDPAAVNVSLPIAMMMSVMPASAGPAVSPPTTAAAAVGINANAQSEASLPGRLSGLHDVKRSSNNRFSLYSQSLEGVAEVRTPSAGELSREGRRRSGGHNAGSTPQTIPRFVARLSTSPSERRLGEQPPPQHHPDVERDVWRTGNNAETSPPARQKTGDAAAGADANQSLEKCHSSDVTPERSLFDAAAVTATATTTASAAAGLTVADARTEPRPVQRRSGSFTEGECEASEKEHAQVDSESAAVAPLNFQMETV